MRTLLLLFTPLFFLSSATHAGANGTVYRCTVDGKTAYADRPCDRGPSVALPPPMSTSGAGVDASLGAVRTDDSRTLLELEKLRLERERRQRSDERADLRAARAAAARNKQCRRLRQRVEWAREDAAQAQGRQAARAQGRLRRARESLAVECQG
jgi:hypothetical protein